MVTRLYANQGHGAASGTTATNVLLAGGGDNPLLIGGSSGWTFEELDRSPDGPADGNGFRRTTNNTTSYLRAAWTSTGTRDGCRVWVYLPGGTLPADWTCVRLVDSAEKGVINLLYRTTGQLRVTIGTSTPVAASQSPVLSAGWHCITLIADASDSRVWFRLQNSIGTVIHTWDSGSGAYALSAPVAGFRVGEPATSLHGIATMRVGSWLTWGTIDSGWITATEPYTDPPTPPPTTSRVSHYNTAEGLELGAPVAAGVGVGSDGMKFHLRGGTGSGLVSVGGSSITPIKGSRSYVVTAANEQAYVRWGVNSTSFAARMHIALPSGTPSAATRVMLLRNELNEPIASLYLMPNGTIQLQAGRMSPLEARSMGGAVVWADGPVRLELWARLSDNKVRARWGYMNSGTEGEAEIETPLGGVEISFAEFGKLLTSSWNDTFVMDDLAINYRATGHIGGWASDYVLLPVVGPDLLNLEPGTPFTLTVLSGLEATPAWVQTGGTTTPVVSDPVTHYATGETPYTNAGGPLTYEYAGVPQVATALRATERYVSSSGEKPVRLEIV